MIEYAIHTKNLQTLVQFPAGLYTDFNLTAEIAWERAGPLFTDSEVWHVRCALRMHYASLGLWASTCNGKRACLKGDICVKLVKINAPEK